MHRGGNPPPCNQLQTIPKTQTMRTTLAMLAFIGFALFLTIGALNSVRENHARQTIKPATVCSDNAPIIALHNRAQVLEYLAVCN